MHDKTFDNVKQYQFIQSEPAKIDFHFTTISSNNKVDIDKMKASLIEKIDLKPN